MRLQVPQDWITEGLVKDVSEFGIYHAALGVGRGSLKDFQLRSGMDSFSTWTKRQV